MIYPLPGGVFTARGRQTLLTQSLVIAYPTLTPLTPGGGIIGVSRDRVIQREIDPITHAIEKKEKRKEYTKVKQIITHIRIIIPPRNNSKE